MPRGRRQGRESRVEELSRPLGDRQGLSGFERLRALGQHSADLQGEERVPAARFVEPPDGGPRELGVQLLSEQACERDEVQWRNADPVQVRVSECSLQSQAVDEPRLCAEGRQYADGLPLQTADAVPDHPRARRVEPLNVLDGQQDRPRRREQPDRRQERDTHGSRVGNMPHRVDAEERNLEGSALRVAERQDDGVERSFEQIPQRAVGELRLWLRRPTRQHLEPLIEGAPHAGLPQGGLPHAGFALDKRRGWTVPDGPDEAGESCELRVPTEDLGSHHAKGSRCIVGAEAAAS